jgi:hypothetical protein
MRRRQYGQDIAILIPEKTALATQSPETRQVSAVRIDRRFVRNNVINDVLGSQILLECRGNRHVWPRLFS